MIPDWKKLAPHRPLGPRSTEYVAPPSGVGESLAKWVLAGGQTVLVGGPTGVGKSTELAHAASLLQDHRLACLVPFDRWENMRRITVDQLLLRLAGRVVYLAVKIWRLPISREIRAVLWSKGVLPDELLEDPVPHSYSVSASQFARLALNEAAGLSRQGALTLLLDGMEKLPEGPGTLEIFDALGELPEDVEIVTVVPWHVAFGPRDDLVRPGERFVSARPASTTGAESASGRTFMRQMLALRLGVRELFQDDDKGEAARNTLGVPPDFRDLVDRAFEQSGGLPRMFLQLVADAATYARMRRDAAWPVMEDLLSAEADMVASLRRTLLPGDRDRLRDVDGTDGMEMDPSTKVRLMAHGLLLEREEDAGVLLRPHPLIAPLLGEAASHA